jgi:thymidylate synthase
MSHTQTYLDIVQRVLRDGENVKGRNGGTKSLFGVFMEFNLRQGFPLMTCRKLGMRVPAIELEWMLKGGMDTAWLEAQGVHIWDLWKGIVDKANPTQLGRIYGAQWRRFGDPTFGCDQIAEALRLITEEPASRRIIITDWSPNELTKMALPPCHLMFQFSVREGRFLDMTAIQRSMDLPVGGPHDICQFALLLALFAKATGLEPRWLKVSVGDAHVYANQIELATQMVTRIPRSDPSVIIESSVWDVANPLASVLNFTFQHVAILNYNPHPAISFEVSP